MKATHQQFKQLIYSKALADHLRAGAKLGTTIAWADLSLALQRDFWQKAWLPLVRRERRRSILIQVWKWLEQEEDLMLYLMYEFEDGLLQIIFEENPTALAACMKSGMQIHFADMVTQLVYVEDELPPEVFAWPSLQELTLRSYQWRTLPHEMVQLKQLKKLRLEYCSLAQFPTWSLPALEELSIEGGYQLKTMPEELAIWPKVKVLKIHDSDVVVGEWLRCFPQLEQLHLDYFWQLGEVIQDLEFLKDIYIEEQLVDAPSLSETEAYIDFWDRIESYEEAYPSIKFHY